MILFSQHVSFLSPHSISLYGSKDKGSRQFWEDDTLFSMKDEFHIKVWNFHSNLTSLSHVSPDAQRVSISTEHHSHVHVSCPPPCRQLLSPGTPYWSVPIRNWCPSMWLFFQGIPTDQEISQFLTPVTLIFAMIKDHKFCSGPQQAFCRRIIGVSWEKEGKCGNWSVQTNDHCLLQSQTEQTQKMLFMPQ